MKKLLFVIIALAPFFSVNAQELKLYRSNKNPYYWKNRMPDPAYWQQDVYYNIRARVDETANVIEATEKLEYWNNSPDTLRYIFFHLYQNAFVKGSYLHDVENELKVKARLGRYEAAGLGTGAAAVLSFGCSLVALGSVSINDWGFCG